MKKEKPFVNKYLFQLIEKDIETRDALFLIQIKLNNHQQPNSNSLLNHLIKQSKHKEYQLVFQMLVIINQLLVELCLNITEIKRKE